MLLRTIRLLLAALIPLAPRAPAASAPAASGPEVVGRLEAPPQNEASGLAASRVNPGLLWIHDDSGGKPELYALDPQGKLRGTLQIGGVKNEDWEDVASAQFDGRSWLVVGDIGDNDARRTHLLVHFVEEPAAARLAVAGRLAERPAATLRLKFADGPRDCESLAIDPAERALYLLSKRDPVPRLYRVELPSPLASADVTARFLAAVPHLPQPTAAQRKLPGHLGLRRAQPCAMDFAADGSAAVVLTYGDVVLFPRRTGESWVEAFSRLPRRLAPHDLPQAEAACFSADGTHIFVTSERSRTLLRYDRR